MSTAGRKLLSSLVHTGDLQEYMKMSLEPHLFKETEVPLYEFIAHHVAKYGRIPKQATIEDHVGLEEAIVEASEPAAFYLDEVEKRYLHNALKNTVQEVSSLLTDKYPEAAMDVLMKYVSTIYQKRKRRSLFDFRAAEEIIVTAYMAQKTMGNELVMPYGWPTLDDMSGGMRPGDFITYVGRPMAGKTFKLLYSSHNAWKIGRVPLFVSMEMMTLVIAQRLTAMHTKKKLTDLMKAELSTKAYKDMVKSLHNAKDEKVPFWVVDGNLTGTVDDILMLCHQLNPSAVFVDGAYLLSHPDRRLNKWDKQAQNARELKQRVATDLGIPVIASYQLGKESTKANKKKGGGKGSEEIGMEDVYGSDEMSQLSTVMMGLFDNEADVESKITRRVKILKGRNGETGQFTINWDFSPNMNFSEVQPEDTSTMQMGYL